MWLIYKLKQTCGVVYSTIRYLFIIENHRKKNKKKHICQIGQKKILQGTSQLNGSHLFGTSEEFPSTQKVRKEIGKKGKSWYFRMAKFSRESWLIVP